MKLYIRQKLLTWRERFNIQDDSGAECYSAYGEIFSLGRRLHLTSRYSSNEIIIRRKIFTIMPRYYIYRGSRLVTEVVQKLSFLKSRYEAPALGWTIVGSVTAHDYVITNGSETVAVIKKAWLKFPDYYELEVFDSDNADMALAMVLTLDCMRSDSEEAAAASAAGY